MLVKEHRFHSTRKWRFDYAHPASMVAIELDGGVYSGGRHTRGAGYTKDCEKLNTATLMGWAVIRLTPEMITMNNIEAIRDLMMRRCYIGVK